MKIDKVKLAATVAHLESHRLDPDYHKTEYAALTLLQQLNTAMQNGWVLMPSELTAENGAKYAMIGEFKEDLHTACPVCYEDEDEQNCEVCDGEGHFTQNILVEWTTIKAIYKKVVELFS